MPNSYFRFKEFTVHQDQAAMKVTTDACLFGGWIAAKLAKQDQSAFPLLDIGAGTGLLSLMLAQKTNAIVDAIEIDQDAAEQAGRNFATSPWNDRLTSIHQDVLRYTPLKFYNVVVSNPPFYENELTGSGIKKNLAHHDAGLLLRDLISLISGMLFPENGSFFLLLPQKRLDEVLLLIKQNHLHVHTICKVRQSVNHDFFRAMIAGTNCTSEESALTVEELSIRDINNEYTDPFKTILKDFYLYL